MPTIRVASFNVEWMNKWFGPDADAAAFRSSYTEDGETTDVADTANEPPT